MSLSDSTECEHDRDTQKRTFQQPWCLTLSAVLWSGHLRTLTDSPASGLLGIVSEEPQNKAVRLARLGTAVAAPSLTTPLIYTSWLFIITVIFCSIH